MYRVVPSRKLVENSTARKHQSGGVKMLFWFLVASLLRDVWSAATRAVGRRNRPSISTRRLVTSWCRCWDVDAAAALMMMMMMMMMPAKLRHWRDGSYSNDQHVQWPPRGVRIITVRSATSTQFYKQENHNINSCLHVKNGNYNK